MALDSSVASSDNFDLSNWKITLPVDSKGEFSGTAMEVESLSGHRHWRYVHKAAAEAMTFVDTFTVDTKPGAKSVDVIVDNVPRDTIRLDETTFIKLAHGELSSSGFVANSKALDTNDRTIHDKTADLFYDADGTGSTAAIKFAAIGSPSELTTADFIIN